jgi:hypothetical protein
MSYTFPSDEEISNFKKHAGRRSSYEELSQQAINTMATRLERQRLSDFAKHVIYMLAHGGVLSSDQLSFLVAESTLDDYTQADKRMLDRLPYSSDEVIAAFQEHGLPCESEKPRLYVLGPVGIELARRQLEMTPVTGYLSYSLERIMHDVITNEIILRLYRFGKQHGWRIALSGTSEGALYSADYSHKILEPDALVTMQKDDEEPLLFCIEYHNEDHRTRAERKIDKYELVRANNEKIWQTTWETDNFPGVLAVFRKRIVGEGYHDKLKAEPVGVQFYGKLLKGVMQDNLAEWANFTSGQKEPLFG